LTLEPPTFGLRGLSDRARWLLPIVEGLNRDTKLCYAIVRFVGLTVREVAAWADRAQTATSFG
jgi:hypothetical protein